MARVEVLNPKNLSDFYNQRERYKKEFSDGEVNLLVDLTEISGDDDDIVTKLGIANIVASCTPFLPRHLSPHLVIVIKPPLPRMYADVKGIFDNFEDALQALGYS